MSRRRGRKRPAVVGSIPSSTLERGIAWIKDAMDRRDARDAAARALLQYLERELAASQAAEQEEGR